VALSAPEIRAYDSGTESDDPGDYREGRGGKGGEHSDDAEHGSDDE
jgi:hypothetical protein